ncbi:unnamed protein product [Caenorhabditis sp. 36 PRJEB53466]|nr:unnamed protein product [Caenorhabditis sp. 36 PRJEB53466]
MQCVCQIVRNETFSRERILQVAFAARIVLVNFTDIDYHVFSDAAKHVSIGGSPFDRATYRYTPALAWILYPVRAEMEDVQTTNVVIYWLANPLTAIISARGNAESIVSAIVLLNIILLQKGCWKSAALVHGALAIQFKIYPLIYLPSVFLSLSTFRAQKDLVGRIKSLFTNWKGFAYVLIALSSFALVVLFFFRIYGQLFLDEYLIYHIKRKDLAHNFSPYFYLLFLYSDNPTISQIIGFGAFVPQILLTVVFAFRYYEDLPFCWFLSTFAFVAYNKVCTSQYFVWYILLLPLVAHKIEMSRTRTLTLIAAWFVSQGLWLLPAYLFEFQGYNTFFLMFLASCLFVVTNTMVFYLIGLGLGDVEDITVKGLNIVKKCARVHLEAYTSILCYGLDKTNLENFYGREVIEADRTVVEQESDAILKGADTEDVALLVVGDPFGATTHADLVLRAKQQNIPVRVIHNASIMNAVGCCGLQLYNFGETVSIVMWTDEWQPESYYDKIALNRKRGMHTLCLLDIKTKEQTVENMMRGRKIFEPARYQKCSEAARQLLTICERRRGKGEVCAYDEKTMVVGLARVGWDNQKIVYSSMEEMSKMEMGEPLHSLIIPGETHHMEVDMLETFRTN